MRSDRPSLTELLRKEPWILAMLAVGLLLLLWPGSGQKDRNSDTATEAEIRLRQTLGKIEGVGEVQVLLAQGNGRGEGYLGAVIVCEGAGSSAVRLRIVQAVAAFTGLGTDKIIVEKWKSS